MNELIKSIREYVGLSQQDFADKLGVTFATINRWENERSTPNKLAQMKLYEYCKAENIPVCDMLLTRIQNEADRIASDGDRLVLFHGSKRGIEGQIQPISRTKCDFGAGFYMGTEPLQPLTLICDFDKSKFYIVSISIENLSSVDIPIDLDWAMTVAFNRGKMDAIKGTEMYDKYSRFCDSNDVISGCIADDRMFYVLDNFFLGNITDIALLKSLSALQLGRQYVAVSQRGCDAIRVEKEIPVSYLEKRVLQDISEENRSKGISFAKEICKNYRREGQFFDEIIDKAKED